MRLITDSEIRFVAGGLMKEVDDDDGGGGGGGGISTEPTLEVHPDPVDTTTPSLPSYDIPSDPVSGDSGVGGGGGGSSSSTDKDGHTHTSELAQTISNAFDTSSAKVQLTDGKPTGASYDWVNYQSTAGVAASNNHMEVYDTIDLFDGTKLQAKTGLTDGSINLETNLSGKSDTYDYSISTVNNDISSAEFTYKGETFGLGGSWGAKDVFGLHMSKQFDGMKLEGRLDDITSTSPQLSLSLEYDNGVTESINIIHESATTNTNHDGYSVQFSVKIPY